MKTLLLSWSICGNDSFNVQESHWKLSKINFLKEDFIDTVSCKLMNILIIQEVKIGIPKNW